VELTLLLVALLPLVGAMITPLFRLEQDDKHVIVIARTPYVKAHEAEMDVTRSGFKMHVKPYFLSLSFKQPLREGEPEKASWCALTLTLSRPLPPPPASLSHSLTRALALSLTLTLPLSRLLSLSLSHSHSRALSHTLSRSACRGPD